MKSVLEIDVSVKAVRLNPIKLASDERYWIVSMSDVVVDGNAVTTDAHERICRFWCHHNVTTNRTVGWFEKIASESVKFFSGHLKYIGTDWPTLKFEYKWCIFLPVQLKQWHSLDPVPIHMYVGENFDTFLEHELYKTGSTRVSSRV